MTAPSSIDPAALQGPLPSAVDVIVVGAGSAGCVLAARLSERADRTVLLVESGELITAEAGVVPGEALSLMTTPAVRHDLSAPQAGLGGRRIPMASGHAIGGSSAINTMSWFHGQPEDYDSWVTAGATGWGWSDVASVLRRIEHFALGADDRHGAGGPMVISAPAHLESLEYSFLAAAEESGLPLTPDLNSARRHGVGTTFSTIRAGRRHSVVDGYLVPALHRPNLIVRSGTAVDRVIFDQRRAVGVACGDRTVRAGRVVLSAGALRTPQLLMLSGVGPGAHLTQLGIPVVAAVEAVGENLHDHPRIAPVWPVTEGRTLLDAHDEGSLREYRLTRRGPLSVFAPISGFLPLTEGTTLPDIQVFLALVGRGPAAEPFSTPAMSAMTALLAPRSRGRLRLVSAAAGDPPHIDPAYLTHPDDIAGLRAGVQRISAIFDAPALRAVTGPRRAPAPGATNDEVDAFIRENLATFWHYAGTARMGTGADSVVDPRLAVHGTENLYVADASVMPSLTRGNPQAATIMIAERAAALLDHQPATASPGGRAGERPRS